VATQRFLGFHYEDDALDSKTKHLCSIVAAAVAGCSD
jgi:alkylhydroperoxidase/carboxymuconolactone decarboxylase family protein YurZ